MDASADEAPKSAKRPAELWVVGAVAAVALLCVSLLAVALVLILGKGSLIQVNPVFNGAAVPASTSPSAPARVESVPSQPASPSVERGWIQQNFGAALPGALATPVAKAAVPAPPAPTPAPSIVPTRPAPPRPVAAAAPVAPAAEEAGDSFTQRGDVNGYYSGTRALPPVRYPDKGALASSTPFQKPAATPLPQATPVLPPTRMGLSSEPASAAASPVEGRPAVRAEVQTMAPVANATQTAAPLSSKSTVSVVVSVAAPASPTSASKSTVSVAVSVAAPAAPASVSGTSAVRNTAGPASETGSFAVAAARTAPSSTTTAPVATPAPASPGAAKPGAGGFARSSFSGNQADVDLVGARSTASFEGTTASAGTLFFVAHVLVVNKLDVILPVGADAFDLRDADGDSYMAEPSAEDASAPAPLPAGGRAKMEVVFVVPTDAALCSLALALPSETDVLPLSKK